MKYKILRQDPLDERTFHLMREDGKEFKVDIYTDGAFTPPEGADKTDQSWKEWLATFVGKEIFIERLSATTYFSGGETYLIN